MNRLQRRPFPHHYRSALFIASAIFIQLWGTLPSRAADTNGIGQPVIGRNADGTLELFAVDPNGVLRHRWQKQATGDWSAWSDLGAGFLPGIAVAERSDGRMEVLAVDQASHNLRCLSQREKNSSDWSDWTNLGGAIRPPISAGQNSDGRLEVFATAATNNSVEHIWQISAAGDWSPWSNLGGAVAPGLAVARNLDGRLELFAIAAENHSLVHCWQQTSNASTQWSDWANLGGSVLPGFAVAENIVGTLEVFAVNGTNQTLNRICQASASDSRRWTPWTDFGARVESTVSVAKTGTGRLEIFAANVSDSSLLHRWEVSESGPDVWSPWKTEPKMVQNGPVVAQNEDGNLEIFALEFPDGKLIHQRQIGAGSGWLDWSTLDYHTPQYSSRLWQIDDGLPDNLVQAITQTRDGYLWVGTSAGLARFDGTQFIVFTPKNAPALMNISVTALCADRDRALWVGTDGGGLTRIKDGEFAHFGVADGLAGEKVHAICQTTDGSLWIGTDHGMNRYHNGKFTTYTQTNGLSADVVHNIYEDNRDNLWIATGKGLNRLRPDGAMDSFIMPNRLPNDSVRAICQDKGDQIWIGSNNGMLWYNQIPGRGFYPYNTRYGLSDPFVSAICEDHDGNLWVGTYSGLNRFRAGKFYSELDSEGLPFDKVNALFEDREGNLWVGTEEGLARIQPKKFSSYTRQNGLTHNNTTTVLQARNGSFWIGTWGGGLDELKDEKVTAYTSTNGFSQDLIVSLCEGRDGSIWAGADYDGGLTRLKNRSATHYTWKDGLPGVALRVLREDSRGTLWIGTAEGLFRFADGKFNKVVDKNHPVGNDIHSIYEDHAGSVWIGSEKGLSCWNNGAFANLTKKNRLSDNTVIALFEDRDHSLWIGTKSGGLNRLKDGKLTTYTSRDGLFSDEIFSIVEGHGGWLWMSCSKGVFRVRKSDLRDFDKGQTGRIGCIPYGKADGMESAECKGVGRPASWQDHDGRLWFPTSKGLVMVDPAAVTSASAAPAVHVRQIISDRRSLIPDAQVLAMDTTNSPDVPLQIPPTRGELQIEYSALNLSSAEKSRFKYKLDGINPDWVDAGARRAAYYNGIPPGRYNFHVIACNEDGVWNETGPTLSFVLLPFYWQTWWFRMLAAALVIGGVAGTARYLTRRKMQRKLEMLKQRHAIEKERGRIAKDIHDDLGSNLTRITMLGERVEEGLARDEEVSVHVRKIIASARHSVQSMDEIVWAVNPENDTLDSFVNYISVHAAEFFEGTDVRCRLEIPVQLPFCELSAELRHHLFLAVKEAFNNVLKHAQASEVTVRVAATDRFVEIVIEDNGRGFNLNDTFAEPKGNGLANLSRRMENLGGQLQVTSQPEHGVKLKFMVKLEPKLHA